MFTQGAIFGGSAGIAPGSSPTFAGLTLADAGAISWTTDSKITRYAAKQLMISGDGTGTAAAQQGFVLGNIANNYAGIGNSALQASIAASAALTQDNSGNTYISGPSGTDILFMSGGYAGTEKGRFGNSTAGNGLSITAGTATTDVNALSMTQTWNAAGVTFNGIDVSITDTASAAGSMAFRVRGGAAGATALMRVSKNGELLLSGATATSTTGGIATNAQITVGSGTGLSAGGSAGMAIQFGTQLIGLYAGTGAPTVSASQGSLYMRTDGSSTSTRAYVNTDGGTTWTAITTAT